MEYSMYTAKLPGWVALGEGPRGGYETSKMSRTVLSCLKRR